MAKGRKARTNQVVLDTTIVRERHTTARAYAPAVTAAILGLTTWGSIVALAGKETEANILVGLFVAIAQEHWPIDLGLLAFTVGAILWAIGERKLRKDHIEGAGATIERLERLIDPDRSSSNLTPRGNTP